MTTEMKVRCARMRRSQRITQPEARVLMHACMLSERANQRCVLSRYERSDTAAGLTAAHSTPVHVSMYSGLQAG